jgi:signal transduction histidine kinase
VGYIGSAIDISERNRLAHEREEARIREQAALDVNQRMEKFLATASHDLRNPVTVALGRVQLAQMHLQQLAPTAEADAPSVLERNLAHAEQAVQRLSRMVDRLFDLAQLQSGQLDLQLATLDLKPVVQDAVTAQRVASPDRRIKLQLPAGQPVLVLADADRLGQVVTNYLSNAIKYSPAHRLVTVRLKVTKAGAIVSVRDGGPGIPLDEQARVWDLYHRVPGIEAQSGGGLGLGLHICRGIIEHHGGQVGLDSTVGKGSNFWFALPVVPAAVAADDSAAPSQVLHRPGVGHDAREKGDRVLARRSATVADPSVTPAAPSAP